VKTDTIEPLAIDTLPATARELAQLIGMQKALHLVETLGGTTFPVPKRETKLGELRFNVLADVVGVEAADAMVRRFHGTDLYIPRCAEALRNARDAAICAEYDRLTTSMSGNEAVQRLARAHRLSDRHIFNILKRMPVTTVNVGGAVQLSLLG